MGRFLGADRAALPPKPGPDCFQVPSFAYKAEGEQRGTIGMTFCKISRIHAPLKVMRG